MLVTQAGILIRTPVDSIRTAGRATQGVIVMRFKEEGDHVISLAHETMRRAAPGRGIRPSGAGAKTLLPECLSEHRGSCSRGDGSPIQNHLPKGFS